MSLVLGELSTILTADRTKLDKGLDDGKRSVRAAGADMERIAKATGEAMGEQIVVGADGRLRNGRGRFVAAAEDLGDAGGDGAGGGFLSSFGGKLKTGMLAVGAAAAAAFSIALVSAIETDAAQAKLAAQLGGSAEYAADMGRIAGKVYARGFGESAADVGETLRSVLTSGLLPEDAADADIERITVKAQGLADVFGQDVTATARAAGQMIRNGLAKNADEAFDLLTRGFQQSGDHAGDLLDTVSEYSTKFRDLGLDGQQALGLIQQGLKAGARDADTVADALKEFAIRAIDGSKASADGYKALGLSAGKMSAQIAAGGDGARKGLDVVLDRLRAIKDPVERDAAAVALFGTKAEDLGDALFALDADTAVDALGNVAGAADKMGKTLEESASHKIESFKRQAMGKLTELGGGVIGFFEKVAGNPRVQRFLAGAKEFIDDEILPALRRLGDWIDQHVIPVLGKLADEYLAKGKQGLDELRQALKDNEPELKQFAGWLETVAKFVLEKVVPVVGPLFTGSLRSTFTMVRIGISTIAGFVRAVKSIGGAVSATVDWAKDRFDRLMSFVGGLRGRVRKAVGGLWDGVKDSFRSAINWIIGKWNNLSFSLPGVNIPGIGQIGGGTLSTPNIPMLAAGGIVPATPAGRLVRVSEAGEDEAIAPLSRLLPMIRDAVADGDGGGDTYVYVTIDGEQLEGRIDKVVRKRDRDLKRRVTSGAGARR